MYVYAPRACWLSMESRRELQHLELELLMVVSHCVHAWNQSQVLQKSSGCSLLRSPVSSSGPHILVFLLIYTHPNLVCWIQETLPSHLLCVPQGRVLVFPWCFWYGFWSQVQTFSHSQSVKLHLILPYYWLAALHYKKAMYLPYGVDSKFQRRAEDWAELGIQLISL